MKQKQLRTKRIPAVPVTPDEHRKIKELAESEHLQVVDLIRQLVLKAADAKQQAAA